MMRASGPVTRGVIFAAGYVVVVQNSNLPVPLKLFFLALSLMMAVLSAASLVSRPRELPGKIPRSIIWSIALAAAMLLLGLASLVWTPATGLDQWIRDALTYIFFPVAILIGLDFGLAASRRLIWATIWALGLFGAAAFSVTWLQRRGADSINVESFGIASSFVPIPAIALGLAIFCIAERRSFAALFGSLLVAGILIVSGGRTIWIYVLVGVAVALAAAVFTGRVARAAIVVVGAILGAAAALSVSAQYGSGIAADRFSWFSRFADNGWLVFAADGSAIERSRAYDWTLQLWADNPLWGRGWGQPFPSVTSGTLNSEIYTLDSPFVALAKFGVVGAAVWSVAVILSIGVALHMARRETVTKVSIVIAVTMAAVLVLNGYPLENRGFPIFIFCIIAQACGALREPDRICQKIRGERVEA